MKFSRNIPIQKFIPKFQNPINKTDKLAFPISISNSIYLITLQKNCQN